MPTVAHDFTAADGRFYYVVPEAEYCELSRLRYTSRPAAPEGD